MEFLRRADGNPKRLGVLSASLHPLTRAHLGLAHSALDVVDEVVFVMPRRFPHKRYELVSLKNRMALVTEATSREAHFSVAITNGGLFIEIARECHRAYGDETELWFLCGRDAAERIVNWDYGEPGAFEKQLREFGLLVADREGRYEPPDAMRGRIRHLPLDDNFDGVSASEVRLAIAEGREWEHLVPESIVDRVRQLYAGR